MSNGFTKSNFLHTAPKVLVNDAGMNPLVDIIAGSLSKLGANLHLPNLYARIDELPEDLLDILAKDFKVDWYDYNWNIDAKRATIKDSFYVHRHLGTKGAVLKAVCDVYSASSLQEWFEYGGEPYYFRIIVEASQQLAPISLPGIMRSIDMFKSARSHLDGGMIIVSITCGIVIRTERGGNYYQTRITGTYPRIATHGNVSKSQIVIETAGPGQAYRPPATGEIVTGTHPTISTHGNVSQSQIDVETEETSQAISTPATGEIVAGTHPNISTHGNLDEGDMSIDVSSGGTEYITRRCGDAFGSLM